MKILLLCNKSPWPPKDGGASATLNIIKRLSACNISIKVLTFNTSKHFTNIESFPLELLKTADYQFINISTKITPVNLLLNLIFSRKPYNTERFRNRKFTSELKKVLRNKYDIIQIEGLSMYHYLSVIRKITTTPVVYRPHNIENIIWSGLVNEEKNIFKSAYFRILARRLKKLEKGIINKFDAVVPISPADLEWLKTEGLSCPSLLSVPGYNPAEIHENTGSGTGKVFFIGALDWLPNILGLKWFIKEVWPIVLLRIPESQFIIAGRNASEKTIAALKGENIFFAGEVESSSEFIRDKTIMIVPLFSGSGIRMKILEGMCLGQCIVATPVAADGIDYENNKDLFVASQPATFASLIINLLSDPTLRKVTGENAIKNVRKNYNILASTENLINFYRELMHDN
jgi:glycosyltransferase involved in cell wall biosynthesis